MARGALAGIYLRHDNKATAESVLQQAANDLPDTMEAAQLLAAYYGQTNQTDRIEPAYADLVAKHPKSVPLRVIYTRVLLAKKEVDKTRPIVADLVKTNSGDPDVIVLNGTLLLGDGKINDAFNLLQKAGKNNPDNLPIKILLAHAAQAKGDLAVAEQSFRDATRINPKSVEGQEGLARIAIQKNDSNSWPRSPRP